MTVWVMVEVDDKRSPQVIADEVISALQGTVAVTRVQASRTFKKIPLEEQLRLEKNPGRKAALRMLVRMKSEHSD